MERFWTFRCRFAGQAQGIVHLVKSEQNVRVLYRFQLQPPLHYITLQSTPLHDTTMTTTTRTTTRTTLHYTTLHYLYYTTPTLHSTPLLYTTPTLHLHQTYTTPRLHHTTIATPTATATTTTLHCATLH